MFCSSLLTLCSKVTNNRENETVMAKDFLWQLSQGEEKIGRCLNQDNSQNYLGFEFVISTCIKQYCYRTRLCEAEHSRAGDVWRIERNEPHTFLRKCTSLWILLEFASILRKTYTQMLEWMDYGDIYYSHRVKQPKNKWILSEWHKWYIIHTNLVQRSVWN